MNKGQHNNYFWFQTFDTAFTIQRFLVEFKTHLLNKYVCVTAFDSGILHLSHEEKQAGWLQVNGTAISPAITKDTLIPNAGFDEWFVFDQIPDELKLTDIYVNFSSFNLFDNTDILMSFWKEIELNQPLNYIAEGNSLTIVTADEKLKQEIEKNWC